MGYEKNLERLLAGRIDLDENDKSFIGLIIFGLLCSEETRSLTLKHIESLAKEISDLPEIKYSP